MKILLILPYTPYPLDSGGNQAVFSMIEALRQEHSLTLVLRGEETDAIRALRERLPEVEIKLYPWPGSQEDNPYTNFGFNSSRFKFIQYIAASFRRKYYRYLMRHENSDLLSPFSARLKSQFHQSDKGFNPDSAFYRYIGKLAQNGYDAIQCEFANTLPLVYYLPETITRIFIHHELAFVRLENEVALFTDKNADDRAKLKRLKDEELAMLRHFDHIITLTQTDKELLEKELPNKPIYASPAVIYAEKEKTFTPCGRELCFVGNSAHFPNLDGLLWFCENVVPELRKHLPDFCLKVTGKWDDKVKKHLQKLVPEIEFVGFIPELSAYLNGKISIIPIRIGSGMRMKVLESIQAQSPIVITSKGIEGQDFDHETDCLIADTPAGFAAAIARLVADRELQEKVCKNAKNKIKQHYHPQEMIEKRLSIYREIEKTNFIEK
ncbi:MAG: glycosyltransferase [Bacteroidales bacterium]|nr:glycosyltransferase [Bacteroidales bacterium]